MSESYEDKKAKVVANAHDLNEILGWKQSHVSLAKIARQTFKVTFRNHFDMWGSIGEYDILCLNLLVQKKGLSKVSQLLLSFSKFEREEKNLYINTLVSELTWKIWDISNKDDPTRHKVSFKKSEDSRFTYHLPLYDLLLIAHLVNPNLPDPKTNTSAEFFSSKEP